MTACVGVISRQHPSFNEHGLEEGLCVALLEYDVQNITVTYNATVVATVPWPTLPDRSCIYNASVDLPCTYNASVSLPWPDRWRRVEITLTSRGLSVHYGGELALDELQVDDYAPRDGWLVGLAARTGATRAAVHLIDKLRFTAGAAVEGTDAAVAVALNAQQFTPSAAPYRYLADAHARAVFPVGGPTAGGTYVNVSVVSPSDLDGATSVTCRFGARSTDATWEAAGPVPYVACRSPPAAAAGQVQLVVDLMHGGHALTFGSGVPYSYYPVPSVALLEPNAGPVEGGTQVVVYGTGLEFGVGPARCRFGDNVTDAVVELHTGVLLCATPESPGAVPRSTPLEVSLNGQQYHHDGVAVGATGFSYVDSEGTTFEGKYPTTVSPPPGNFESYLVPHVLSVSPASGSEVGGTIVTVSGDSFTSAFRNQCRWGGAVTNITWFSTPGTVVNEGRQLTCASPPGDFGVVSLEVSANGQQFTSDARPFSYYLEPEIERLSTEGFIGALGTWQEEKVVQPLNGYVMVRVWGSGFVGGTDYRCRIQDAAGVDHAPFAATYDPTYDCIECWSDLWRDGRNKVEVTLNGRQYTDNGRNVTIFRYWRTPPSLMEPEERAKWRSNGDEE